MADPDSDDSLRGETQARDEQTVMPWIWGGLGLLTVAAFIAWILFSGGHRTREPAGAAPTTRSMSQHY